MCCMHTTYNLVFMRYYNCSSKLFALLVYGIDLFSFSCFTASCSADSFCCCCTSLCGSTSQEEVIKSTNVLNLSTYSALSTGVAAAAPDTGVCKVVPSPEFLSGTGTHAKPVRVGADREHACCAAFPNPGGFTNLVLLCSYAISSASTSSNNCPGIPLSKVQQGPLGRLVRPAILSKAVCRQSCRALWHSHRRSTDAMCTTRSPKCSCRVLASAVPRTLRFDELGDATTLNS